MRRAHAVGFALAASVTLPVLACKEAHACSVAGPGPTTAIPRSGATNVPTVVDVVVIEPPRASLSLQGGGKSIPLTPWISLGRGVDSETRAQGEVVRFRPARELEGATEYVVIATQPGAPAAVAPIELTRFTTAAGYGKPAGTAPKVDALSLTRVRYPVPLPRCIWDEYVGFASFRWTHGTFPDTPPDSVVHVLSLRAKNGTHGESFVWIGSKPFGGSTWTGEASGPWPWAPYLDPAREYCLAVGAQSYGEAVLDTSSDPVCAAVAQVSAPGAPPVAEKSAEAGCAVRAAAGRAPTLLIVAVVAWVASLRRRWS
ncbi:MAG: hypothetical protein HYV09_18585 [Deltaproteobacteria bacterium]|nr:hypothetical protein [Deltaproteobacteria bacterium]